MASVMITDELVLEPVRCPTYLNLELLRTQLKLYIEQRMHYYQEMNCQPYIEPKFAEFVFNRSVKGEHVGNGSEAVDVVCFDGVERYGFDVVSLCINRSWTNEKSLMQNFSGNLDERFLNDTPSETCSWFLQKYKEKISNAREKLNLKNTFIALIICEESNFYLIILEVNLHNLIAVKADRFSVSLKNIFLSSFISETLGKVSLYKSKKRLELRLTKNILSHPFTEKLF